MAKPSYDRLTQIDNSFLIYESERAAMHVASTQIHEAAPLRGADLNHHPEIGRPTPSAERVAEVVAARLEPGIAALGGRLLTTSVWEGPDNRVDLCLE